MVKRLAGSKTSSYLESSLRILHSLADSAIHTYLNSQVHLEKKSDCQMILLPYPRYPREMSAPV